VTFNITSLEIDIVIAALTTNNWLLIFIVFPVLGRSGALDLK